MNVQELTEKLSVFPPHWKVAIAIPADGSGGGADTTFSQDFTVERENCGPLGNCVVLEGLPT